MSWSRIRLQADIYLDATSFDREKSAHYCRVDEKRRFLQALHMPDVYTNDNPGMEWRHDLYMKSVVMQQENKRFVATS